MSQDRRDGLPAWWPMFLSFLGTAATLGIIFGGFDPPYAVYPIVGLLVAGGGAGLADNIIQRKRNGHD